MIKTRCKFKVVGVEDTESNIHEKVYEGEPRYAVVEGGHLYEEHHSHPTHASKKYRMLPTGKRAQNVRLAAQYDCTKSEDLSFAEATPSGEVKIYVNNPAVIGHFVPGEEYYLDLVPVVKDDVAK